VAKSKVKERTPLPGLKGDWKFGNYGLLRE